MQKPYRLLLPQNRDTATVFSAPHSGRLYPEGFVAQSPLTPEKLRSSEDAFVDLLYAEAPSQGAVLLVADAPRAYVDLNRAADELDPALIEGLPRGMTNPRINSGLGVIPRVVAGGRVIHPARITLAEAQARLDEVWHPYHRALAGLLAQARGDFAGALLIDCHSMPRDAIHAGVSPRPQVILGDRFGASCCPSIMARVEAAFQAQDFRTVRNQPFAGAHILKTYGRPAIGQHAIQIEIDRSLYMDEATITPHQGFEVIRHRLSQVVAELAQIGRELGRKVAVAAE